MDAVNLLVGVLAFLVGLAVRHFLSSYVSEKGKNLATKEDIDEITKIVEKVKSNFSTDLEFLKWQLSKKARIHQLVAEREIRAIEEIGNSLFNLKMATANLRPALDQLPTDVKEKKQLFQKRWAIWAEKHDAFLTEIEQRRLFLPQVIYEKLIHVKTLAVEEGVSFETNFLYDFQERFNIEQYKQARENVNALVNSISELTSLIHNRYEIEGLASNLGEDQSAK